MHRAALLLVLIPLGCGFVSKKPTPGAAATASTAANDPAADQTTPAPPTADEPVRPDVSEPVAIDGLTVRVVSVETGKAQVYTDGKQMLVEDARVSLLIRIELRAGAGAKQYVYRTWRADAHRLAVDDAGNASAGRLGSFSAEYPGYVSTASLSRDDKLADTLVFEPPAESAKYVDLSLPGKNAGVEGSFHFRIPREAWAKK